MPVHKDEEKSSKEVKKEEHKEGKNEEHKVDDYKGEHKEDK